MFKNLFTHNSLSDILGILSVVIFFAIFTFRSLLSCLLSKGHISHMSQLPLADDATNKGERK